jgi:hypothetical protein
MATSPSLKPLPAQVASLLNDCQKSLANHAKTAKALREQEKRDPKGFSTHFIAAVDRALVVPGREAAVEVRVVYYRICIPDSIRRRDSSSLLSFTPVLPVAHWRRGCFDTWLARVRWRTRMSATGAARSSAPSSSSSQRIKSSFRTPHVSSTCNTLISENLLDVIKEALMVRTKDKVAGVRSEVR